MRSAFVKTLVELAEQDSRVLLLTGDLGFMALEPFSNRFPERFYNVGIAEQNMVGLATGLAEAGYIPFVYSIVPFAVLRPYEFIRNGPIAHKLPVRVVGVGGGLDYGLNGLSHFGIEDVGILRIQPDISIVVPADYQQASAALRCTWNLAGPVYYRLEKDDKTIIPGLDGRFEPGHSQLIREGSDLLILSMGGIAAQAVKAAELLACRGVSCSVAIVASLNPAPQDDLAALLSQFPLALTLEAHYIVGGLGSLVSEIVAERNLHCRIIRQGVKSTPNGPSGGRDYMHKRQGLTAELLAATIERIRDSGTDWALGAGKPGELETHRPNRNAESK